ncbi:HAD-IIB family hydrolase (plasmid) [Sphingomonas paeninsulae]|uniref:phosphomannomutase n=1 Tax=Sphingomonas paeninsulae TaxID=2319844 RepID=A0A494TF86_SPHPE|nr:HAD-IIB family hydrolase [Sphingomonas paeninsulae]AYJ84566.1 HAD-IIB family hydrolase [Sphingomonas paeninsulae]
MKRLVAYDLDGTLAESKQPIDPETAALLARLTKVALVAVISGGDWPQFEEQLIGKLPDDTDLDRLFLLPASGTKLYRFRARWDQVYAELFSEEERKRILKALASTVAEQGLGAARSWGDRIEYRGSQITFSGLGQRAPLDAKQAWDADFAKRKRLQAALIPLLPDFAVRVGGSTSIDITRKGIDKAYGMAKLAKASGIPADEMIFIGDALYPGGNDYPVHEAGFDTIGVRDVAETRRVTEAIALCLK